MFPNPEFQFCAFPDVDEAAVAIDERNGESHGGGQRLIERIATGNMRADFMDPINVGFNLHLLRIHSDNPSMIFLGCGHRSGGSVLKAKSIAVENT
jgi:hypothetical protein